MEPLEPLDLPVLMFLRTSAAVIASLIVLMGSRVFQASPPGMGGSLQISGLGVRLNDNLSFELLLINNEWTEDYFESGPGYPHVGKPREVLSGYLYSVVSAPLHRNNVKAA